MYSDFLNSQNEILNTDDLGNGHRKRKIVVTGLHDRIKFISRIENNQPSKNFVRFRNGRKVETFQGKVIGQKLKFYFHHPYWDYYFRFQNTQDGIGKILHILPEAQLRTFAGLVDDSQPIPGKQLKTLPSEKLIEAIMERSNFLQLKSLTELLSVLLIEEAIAA